MHMGGGSQGRSPKFLVVMTNGNCGTARHGNLPILSAYSPGHEYPFFFLIFKTNMIHQDSSLVHEKEFHVETACTNSSLP